MRAISFTLVAAVLLGGCAIAAQPDPVPAGSAGMAAAPAAVAASKSVLANLDGTQWRFERVAGKRVPAAVTATLQFADGHASGKAGCNTYGAKYEVAADGAAQFQQTLSTKMACLQPSGAMQVEHGIFTAFQETAKVEMRGGTLVLLDAAGKPLARLVHTAAAHP
ncbi:MAG TPA: META domain-containing protein [Rhodanobacteraceae bacterium]|nr:META domain-containing protein [Rhodanobacteraceae bacterium]